MQAWETKEYNQIKAKLLWYDNKHGKTKPYNLLRPNYYDLKVLLYLAQGIY